MISDELVAECQIIKNVRVRLMNAYKDNNVLLLNEICLLVVSVQSEDESLFTVSTVLRELDERFKTNLHVTQLLTYCC